MGTRWSRILELLIVSVNYILIGYALSNIAMLLQSNPLFILFYASEIWVTGLYWRRAAKLTGSKLTDKVYTRHTGYPGGQRFATPADYLRKKPEFIIEKAVKGMLPRTRLGAAVLKNLKVYAGAEHPHAAQSPKTIKLNEIK